jgi:uncharacterized protein with PIN domain
VGSLMVVEASAIIAVLVEEPEGKRVQRMI